MPLISMPTRAHLLAVSFYRLFLPALLLVAACAAAYAQTSGGGVGSSRGLPSSSDGNNIIQGRVFFPSDPKEGKRFKVRLTSSDSLNQTTSTDEDGTFSFNGLPNGHFTVTVEGGKEFDDATESVGIERESSPGARNVSVSITLKPKGTAAAFSKIPKAARDLYAKGMEAVNKGDSKKAIEQFNGAIALYPEFGAAHDAAGLQYLKLGQPDKAAEEFQAALKLSPDELSTRLNYGVSLLQQKKYADAETPLREVLAKNDSLPTAHMYLGISLMSQQKLDDAEKELLRAVSFNSNEVSAAHRYLGGIYWGKRDYQRAADELETYLKLAPKAPDAERTRTAIKELRAKKS